MVNPFVFGEPLDLRIHSHLLARATDIDTLTEYIDTRLYCLVLGPRYSGRTTILRALSVKRELDRGCASIYIHPLELNLTSESGFFASLAVRIERELRALREDWWPLEGSSESYGIDSNADQFNSFIDDLLASLKLCLVLLLDAIERIPPNILTRFAHIAHALYSERTDKIAYKNLCVIFAGSLSLRHLTFHERPELSPFNVCEDVVLADLDPVKSRKFLEAICTAYNLRFRYDAISAIVEYAGGDLNMLQHIATLSLAATQPSRDVDRKAVEAAVGNLLGETSTRPDDALRFLSQLIEEDPPTLDLVLAVLERGCAPYQSSPSDDELYNAFKITYPEMAGVLALDRPGGIPTIWRFRNKLTELYLPRHFTPQRIVKTYSALGNFESAVSHCDALLRQVRERFEKDVVDFDDSDLKDVLIAFTNRIYQHGAHEAAFEFLGRLLKEGFGCSDATYYDYVPPQRTLREVKFLAHLFSNKGTEINVDDPDKKGTLELRALHGKLYAIETDQGATRIALPLLNLEGDATGVLVLRGISDKGGWVTTNVRIQIIQRAVRAINVALSKVELDHKSRIADSVRLMRKGGPAVSVFVAHRFSEELLTNLREHLGRVSDLFRFLYLDKEQRVGLLLPAITNEMKTSRLCLFEVSQPNNNVYFEVGLGLGMNKAGLMFWREKPGNRLRLPPLLEGINRVGYADYTSLLENLDGRVESVLNQFLLHERETEYLHFAGITVPAVSKKCRYAVVLDTQWFHDQRDYRGAIDEALTARGLKPVYLAGSDPIINEVLDDGNGRLAPGPRVVAWYNLIRHADVVIARIEKTDFTSSEIEKRDESAVAAQSFIGLGMAFGMSEKNIRLTYLRKDLSGVALEVPADLRGMDCVEYNTFSELRERIGIALRND